MQVINHDTQTGTAAATANLSSVDVNQAKGYSVVIQATVATAAAKTFDSLAAATAVLNITSDITLTSVASGAARNDQTFKTVVNAAAANPTDTVLVAFTGSAAAIIATITPNDGTNNTATPVDLTTAELVELINSGVVVGKTVTLTDASSLRALQTATGGGAAALAAGGEGDDVTATFSGGVDSEMDLDANTMSIPSHGFYTGLKVAATTSGVLPTGLAATDYYAIRVDANTIKLADSQADALAGTAKNLTGEGSGVHTLTPAALAGGSYKLQGSLDDVVFVDLGVSANITATANFIHEKVDPMFKHVRVVFAATAGQIAYDVQTMVKG